MIGEYGVVSAPAVTPTAAFGWQYEPSTGPPGTPIQPYDPPTDPMPTVPMVPTPTDPGWLYSPNPIESAAADEYNYYYYSQPFQPAGWPGSNVSARMAPIPTRREKRAAQRKKQKRKGGGGGSVAVDTGGGGFPWALAVGGAVLAGAAYWYLKK